MQANTAEWWHLFTQIGHIQVFHVDAAPHPHYEEIAHKWLDADEQLRAHRFQADDARRRFVLCRAALRSILCQQLHCANKLLAFSLGSFGKPFAKVGNEPQNISFNVSHNGSHGLVAIAPNGGLGIDLAEYTPRKKLDGLIKRVCSTQEQTHFQGLNASDKLNLFYKFWTIKEALAKAHGQGISLGVAGLEIPEKIRFGAKCGISQFPQIPNTAWFVEDIGTNNFAAAIVYEADHHNLKPISCNSADLLYSSRSTCS